MSSELIPKPQTIKKESVSRSFGYTEEFKDDVNKNPRLIESFNESLREIETAPVGRFKNLELEKRGYKFKVIWDYWIPLIDYEDPVKNDKVRNIVLQVTLKDKKIFVKCERSRVAERGFHEFVSSEEAQESLKDLPGVRVVPFSLGYTDNKGNSYFVSEWQDYIELDKYLETSKQSAEKLKQSGEPDNSQNLYSKLDNLRKRIVEIQNVLKPNFHDVFENNMFYDEVKDEIVLFDLIRK